MGNYYLYLLAAAGLLILLMLLPVLVRVYASRKTSEDVLWVEVELLPHLKMRFNADLRIKEKKTRKHWRESIDAVNQIRPVLRYMASHTKLMAIRWQTSLGTGDPYYTGILTGYLWGAKVLLVKLFNTFFKGCPPGPDLMVTPNFKVRDFTTTIDCIFKTRIGYIIITVFRLVALKIQSARVKRLSKRVRVKVTESELR